MIFGRRQIAIARVVAVLVLLALGAEPRLARAEDDWKVIEKHTEGPAPDSESAPKSDAIVEACGEAARPASDSYQAIVSQLNDMNGVNFRVYESVAEISPHVREGGCIFYNAAFLARLLANWMNISDPEAMNPMLYAIFAHEEGHLIHQDFDPRNERIGAKAKELAADQFAGYTLERLGMRLDSDEITRYYQLTGDDYFGQASEHGTGAERTEAFRDGWHRAQVGLPEQGQRPAGGFDAAP